MNTPYTPPMIVRKNAKNARGRRSTFHENNTPATATMPVSANSDKARPSADK